MDVQHSSSLSSLVITHNIRGGFRGGGGGGFRGLQPPPPNGQSHSINCNTTNVLRYALASYPGVLSPLPSERLGTRLRYALALIYIAKRLVVVVVNSKRVVKPLSRLAVVQPEVLHLLECLLGHSTVLGLGSTRELNGVCFQLSGRGLKFSHARLYL